MVKIDLFTYVFPDLVNVFEVFLPQLLLYPNPSDPLNGEAAALMMRDRTAYDQRVKGFKFIEVICLQSCMSCNSIVMDEVHHSNYIYT